MVWLMLRGISSSNSVELLLSCVRDVLSKSMQKKGMCFENNERIVCELFFFAFLRQLWSGKLSFSCCLATLSSTLHVLQCATQSMGCRNTAQAFGLRADRAPNSHMDMNVTSWATGSWWNQYCITCNSIQRPHRALHHQTLPRR